MVGNRAKDSVCLSTECLSPVRNLQLFLSTNDFEYSQKQKKINTDLTSQAWFITANIDKLSLIAIKIFALGKLMWRKWKDKL